MCLERTGSFPKFPRLFLPVDLLKEPIPRERRKGNSLELDWGLDIPGGNSLSSELARICGINGSFGNSMSSKLAGIH